jgi:hypothetical protein
VHELVAEDVVGVAQRFGERHDDPVLQALGEPARGLRQGRGRRVRLLEVGLVGVHDDRLAVFEIVLEHAAQARVPALGHPGGIGDQRVVFRLVRVEVEALGLQHVPVELLVLDLVAAEVLGLGGHGERREEERR